MASPQTVPALEIVAKFDGITRNDFPCDFVFGTGTSAYQHEGGAASGGRGQSVWDVFTLRTPGRIADGSNGNVAIDMYTKYKEDIKMMKSMGFDAYRFSISWPRILPGGRLSLGVNKEGIDFYNDVIDTCLANGIKPFITLFHWDLPYSLEQEYGGFLSDQVVEDFREFAELCFWEFGDRVKYWITLNEPWTYAVHGYVDCNFPPGKKFDFDSTNKSGNKPLSATGIDTAAGKNYIAHRDVPDPDLVMPKKNSKSINIDSKQESNPAKDVYTVARNMLLAHATAVQSYRTKFQEGQNGLIGITLVSHWFERLTDDRKDTEAAKRALDFMLGWFLKPVLDGDYPESMKSNVPSGNLEKFSDEEAELLRGSIDFLGLNYYTARYAANDPKPTYKDGYYKDMRVAFHTEKDLKPIGPPAGSSWLLIVPWGIQELLKHVKNTYKSIPIHITENGMDEKNDHTITAAEACDDKGTRKLFHQFHLGYVLKAIKENKVDVKGYFAWSWADNFEWIEGYSVRFGLIYVDYMNYLRRCPKDSAVWFSNKFLVKKNKKATN